MKCVDWYEKLLKSSRKWKKKNHARCLAYAQKWCKDNPEKCKIFRYRRYHKNPQKYIDLTKQWYQKNSRKTKIRVRKWKKNNPQKCKIYREIDAQHRRENPKRCNELARLRRSKLPYDSTARITSRLRSRISFALRAQNCTKFHKSEILLGCSVSFFKKHITKQFQPGMTWKNYGYYGWHIDHIRPCISFDLSKVSEQLKCFNYTNLQPLWAKENLSKGGKITGG